MRRYFTSLLGLGSPLGLAFLLGLARLLSRAQVRIGPGDEARGLPDSTQHIVPGRRNSPEQQQKPYITLISAAGLSL